MEGVVTSLVSLGSGIVRRRRAGFIVSLANGAVPRRARQGRQARSRPKRPVGTLLRAMEFLRSVLSDGSGVDRATQSDPVPAPERSSHFARPNGLHRRVGKKSHPGYRSHSSFVDGRDARLVIVRLPSGGDQCRVETAFASKALGGNSNGTARAHEERVRSNRIDLDSLTEQRKKLSGTSGPSCTWGKRVSPP